MQQSRLHVRNIVLSCRFLHTFSSIDNIDLKSVGTISQNALGDVAFFKIGEKLTIVTLCSEGKIDVFDPEENKVIESFTPDGPPSIIRVFDQYPNILFVAYNKQGPGGAQVGTLMAMAGEHRMEVEAHQGVITDMI